jgi:hypothetical protein
MARPANQPSIATRRNSSWDLKASGHGPPAEQCHRDKRDRLGDSDQQGGHRRPCAYSLDIDAGTHSTASSARIS